MKLRLPLCSTSLLIALTIGPSASPAQTAEPTAHTVPGGVVRWSVAGATRCGMRAHTWLALKGVCFYPVDLLDKPGPIPISISSARGKKLGRLIVESRDYGTEEVNLPDIPQANPSPADLRRDEHDRAVLARLWTRRDGPPLFTLPLGEPVRPISPGKSFGVKRIYNGKLAEQAHMGLDYDSPVDSPIVAVADGTVVFAQEMFFEGNAVFIDHGDGLVSMYFHLHDIKVETGQHVRRGETLGREGSTGRATGPHLWFGVRWHDARIDPHFLLDAPERIPAVERATE